MAGAGSISPDAKDPGRTRDLDEVLARVSMREILRRFGRGVNLPRTRGSSFRCNCPFHDDHLQTCDVNETKSVYRCYSAHCGASGGALDLVVRLGGAASRAEALEALADMTGVALAHRLTNPDARRAATPAPLLRPVDPDERARAAKVDDRPFEMPPAHASQPGPGMKVWSYKHQKLTTISRDFRLSHRYADARDQTLGYVLRFETFENGVRIKKWFTPIVWRAVRRDLASGVDAGPGWAMDGFANPRPLYRLNALASRRDVTRVVIVEGEKAADAAQRWFDSISADGPSTVFLSVCGGANTGYLHSDIKALALELAPPHEGVDVYLWPDADQPATEKERETGHARSLDLAQAFAEQIAAMLRAVTEPDDPMAIVRDPCIVRLVDPDPAWPNKFDLGDIDKIGMTIVDFEAALARARKIAAPTPPSVTPEPEGDREGPSIDEAAAADEGLTDIVGDADAPPVEQGETACDPQTISSIAAMTPCAGEAPDARIVPFQARVRDEAQQPQARWDGAGEAGPREALFAGPAREAPRWLGYGGGQFYCLSADTNEIVAISRARITGAAGLSMVANELYWRGTFPARWEGAKPNQVDWGAASAHAREACHAAGVFRPARARGRGVWEAPAREAEAGQPPVDGVTNHDLAINVGRHVLRLAWDDPGLDPRIAEILPLDAYGEAVFVSGIERDHEDARRFGDMFEEIVAAPPTPRDFDVLDRVLDKLPYAPRDALIGPVALRGWMALAPLNALLPTRPHLWLTGASGAGKSWVAKAIVRRLLGPWSFGFIRPVGETKLAATVGADALPIILDDLRIEDRADEKKFQEMIRLARACARQEEAMDLAASTDEGVLGHVLRSSFLFVCPDGMTQSDGDAARFAPIVFAPRRAGDRVDFNHDIAGPAESFADVQAGMRFITRSICRAPAILEAIPHFTAVLADKCERRIADLYAPLLAGWFGHAFEGRIASREDAASFIQGEEKARAVLLAAVARSQFELVAPEDERDLLRILQCPIEVFDPEQRVTLRHSLSRLIAACFDRRAPGGGASLEAATRSLTGAGVKLILPHERAPTARLAADQVDQLDWQGGVLFAPESPLLQKLQRDGLRNPERIFARLPDVFQTDRLRIPGAGRVNAWCMPISYFSAERVDIAPEGVVNPNNVRTVDFRKSQFMSQTGMETGLDHPGGEEDRDAWMDAAMADEAERRMQARWPDDGDGENR